MSCEPLEYSAWVFCMPEVLGYKIHTVYANKQCRVNFMLKSDPWCDSSDIFMSSCQCSEPWGISVLQPKPLLSCFPFGCLVLSSFSSPVPDFLSFRFLSAWLPWPRLQQLLPCTWWRGELGMDFSQFTYLTSSPPAAMVLYSVKCWLPQRNFSQIFFPALRTGSSCFVLSEAMEDLRGVSLSKRPSFQKLALLALRECLVCLGEISHSCSALSPSFGVLSCALNKGLWESVDSFWLCGQGYWDAKFLCHPKGPVKSSLKVCWFFLTQVFARPLLISSFCHD